MKKPITKHERLISGIVGELNLKWYYIVAVDHQGPYQNAGQAYKSIGRSMEQAVRIARKHLELTGELQVYGQAEWDQRTANGSSLLIEPAIFEGVYEYSE